MPQMLMCRVSEAMKVADYSQLDLEKLIVSHCTERCIRACLVQL